MQLIDSMNKKINIDKKQLKVELGIIDLIVNNVYKGIETEELQIINKVLLHCVLKRIKNVEQLLFSKDE